MMFILRVVLYPFAVLYDIITRIRNHMYDTGMKPSTQFDLPVICVGNLAMGGTGKTPMVEYLIRLLPGRIAVVSRGYRRKTKGVRVAGDDDNAATIGDEPYQVHRKFPNVTVAVGEDRAYTIPYVLDHVPDTSIVILDDAFQHRRIRPSFSILLTEFVRPFYRDFVLPSGRLRESDLTIGDEPYQVHRKFPNVTVAVGEDRAYTIPYVLDHVPDTSIVILDDAFQHRRIRPSFSILLTEFVRPFYRDFVLPSGRLRE